MKSNRGASTWGYDEVKQCGKSIFAELLSTVTDFVKNGKTTLNFQIINWPMFTKVTMKIVRTNRPFVEPVAEIYKHKIPTAYFFADVFLYVHNK